ncbi:MAG: cysteine desulfurase family protein [Alphaproteobacteria bacterium]
MMTISPSFLPVYLDANATSPLRPGALAAMCHVFGKSGNPASVHQFGREARRILEDARQTLAQTIQAEAQDIIFTSGGTEANYLALRGLSQTISGILVGATEHESVLGNVPTANLLPVDHHGRLDFAAVETLLQQQKAPALVSVMLAHNETGVLQDIPRLAKLVHHYNSFLHTDAAQALGKVPVSFKELGVDLMSLSAHKLGGPPGIGALVVGARVPLKGILKGGGQEQGLRPGMQSVALAAGFAAALLEAEDERRTLAQQHQIWLREMEAELKVFCPNLLIIGEQSPRLPHVSCLVMPGVPSAVQVMRFDLEGVAVSAGSACSSGKITPSRTLSRMGLPEDVVKSAIRVSLGWHNKREDLMRFTSLWKKLYQELSTSSGKAFNINLSAPPFFDERPRACH